MSFVKQVKSLLYKEILLEWRSKYAFNGILLYVLSTVFVCYLSFRTTPPLVWNALFWIILLFTAINAIAKSFMQESKGKLLYYYTIASPHAIIVSKIIYNIILMVLMAFIALITYSIVFTNEIGDIWLYLLAVLLGSISFSTVFTMISAIASKAGNNGTLMAILSFPVIIPVLMLIIKLSKNAMDGLDQSVSYDEIGVLCIINVIVVVISLILFPYLWRD
ncbi:ABC-2 type transporter [Pseudopedobacter saltans DSM 12145]|uniref:ABC-2 type transporter n=1 Tax=Pseudopedobacter saltans (strain ATCC 51119 / DSM 12145 / JCM 21818 / CCUG 39354 / LMG 10337 / NBRC 100064 / NCIMB 13643) TaxID=762903 RepID=F0S8Q1_PSESL|nr:heme exporter protein CcmB [Pseudopedobacter saltans]ADY52382.1 ABC-2 type transporter [Pseudopedobacter saltans DSM 12145]